MWKFRVIIWVRFYFKNDLKENALFRVLIQCCRLGLIFSFVWNISHEQFIDILISK